MGYQSVQFSHSVVSDSESPWAAARQASLSITNSQSFFKNSCPLSRWCHPTISSSVVSFSSCLQSFPASRSFSRSQFFASGGQNVGLSTSASVLPMTTQDWFPLRWTHWISLQSKGLSRVFSNTTLQKHQFFTWGGQSIGVSVLDSHSNEHPGLISFKMDWLDLLEVQGTLKSLLQHHSSKASILWCSAFFTVQLSYSYMTTGKTIALTRRTFVGKVMSAFEYAI